MIVKDYYKILQLDFYADLDSIKKSYKRLVKEYHPDLKIKDSDEYIKDINEAYKILSNEEKRKEYNKIWKENIGSNSLKHKVYEHQPREFGIKEELMEKIFGIKNKKKNLKKTIKTLEVISLTEAFLGTKRQIEIEINGKLRKIILNTPAGIKNREIIRLEIDKNTEVLVEVLIETGKFYLKNLDLYAKIQIFPWDAKLGKKLEFESIAENILVIIPENTENGKQFKIFNKGYINKDGQRGDLYLSVEYKMPKDVNNQDEIELYKKLREIYD